MKSEVTYVSGLAGGKLSPVGERRRPLYHFSLLISVLSAVLVITSLCVILGWFWDLPSHIKTQHQSPGEDPCQLAPSRGPCTTLSIQRWHYDPPSASCRQFTFGGCQGNANNFHTLRECEATCSLCSQPPDSGPCRGQLERFYFSPSAGQCLVFSYSGCAGNTNNFLSLQDCEATCSPGPPSQSESVCLMDSDPGPCYHFEKRWYFNQDTGSCQQFQWGGCQGNSNNFLSLSKCEEKCTSRKLEGHIMQEETNCHQPAEPGNCGGRFKRYFYDGAENHCSEFLYTGCGGNENNFVSRAACVTSCVEDTQLHIDEICSLELSAGNCSGLEIRYFYDIESEDCQPFNFSGCGGNKNNFRSKEACLDFCK